MARTLRAISADRAAYFRRYCFHRRNTGMVYLANEHIEVDARGIAHFASWARP